MFAPPPFPRTLEASIRDLGSDNDRTRASAIVDLVRHATGSADTRAHALTLLEPRLRDDSAVVRAAAAVGLGDLEATSSLPLLLVAVEDSDAYVRQMAINALGELRDPRATPRLRRALGDERPDVRYQALIAFTRVVRDDSAEVEGALANALSDDDSAIRYIALRLAEEATDDKQLVASAAFLEVARSRLDDSDGAVVLAAAIFLAKLGDDAGVANLVDVVRDTPTSRAKPPKEDERAAVELAGDLALRQTIPALERRAWGVSRLVRDTCSWQAKVALAMLGHARAIAEIDRDLDATRREVVDAAVVAVGRARLVALSDRLERLTARAASPELVAEALERIRNSPVAGPSAPTRARR